MGALVGTPAAAPRAERPAKDGSAPRWWWRPRVRSAFFLGALGLATLTARVFAHLQTDWLWFHELGQERVFWRILGGRWLAGSLAGVTTTGFLLVNFWIVERTAPVDARLPSAGRASARVRRALLPAYLAVSGVAGYVIGSAVVLGSWQQIVLWIHRRPFGIVDPIFHRDIGYFVFSLPLYRQVAHWLLLTIAAALACSFLAHAATGAIRTKPPPVSATRAAGTHLLVLGALLLVVVAWQHKLSQYALELHRDGSDLSGARYTDVHVELPWLRVLVLVALLGAAMLLYAAVRRSWSLPAVALIMVLVAEFVNPAILPAAVQRFIVDPQTLSRERSYISESIAMTRRAYGLDRVDERQLPANATVSAAELRANRDVLHNVQLWDTNVLLPDIDQQQSIGSYYSFPNITVDRYTRGGEPQSMILAERELDLGRLEQSGRTWANDRLAYTHGYGLVAAPAGGLDGSGRPQFVISNFDAGRAPTQVRQPRLYYGVQPRRAEPWVIAPSRREEIEKPLAGDAAEPDYHYTGAGGIPLGGLLSRGLFALRFGDLNLLLSETLGGGSRIILHRDVIDRLKTLAPFLHWEDRPEVVVVRGQIQFLAQGYTTTNSFPYASHVEVGGRQVNYLRGAVVASVDGSSGRVRLYATDPDDPILQAWEAAFPTLFTPGSRMPAALRAHLRYPPTLFEAQSKVWATYHIHDVDDFYTKADAWERPAELSGPVERVGSIRFRFKHEAPRMRPSFMLARLPGDRRLQFMLTASFTPHSQENMSGYLAGTVDGSGRPRLTQLSLPRARLPLGPSQVSRLILAAPGVGDRLRLLNEETTDLGRQAVDAVQLSQPRVVPIGDSFLYVQPIYVTAQGSGVTRVRLVTVYLNGRVGYGATLDDALRKARISVGIAQRSDAKTSTARVR
jgi:uncharacterized membrane protein (UPF0182 family)